MAIFGPSATVNNQLASDARFAAALAYVAEALRAGSEVRQRIGRIAAGVTERVELTGGAFALEQAYVPKARPETRTVSEAVAGTAHAAAVPSAAAISILRVNDMAQIPKSSLKMEPRSTPHESSMANTASIISGGPHR